MGSANIEFAAKVFMTHTQDLTGELWVYGMALMNRATADIDALIDAFETAWVNESGGITEKSHLVKVTYSEWGTVGFTGWHQVRAKPVNHAGGSGAMQPPQNAAVVTLLNTDVTDQPIRSRRGRVYFGMLPSTFVDTDGKLNTTGITAYGTAIQEYQDAANSVPASSIGDQVTDGLCVASPTLQLVFNAHEYGVGAQVDTQRRRREKRAENITYTVFT